MKTVDIVNTDMVTLLSGFVSLLKHLSIICRKDQMKYFSIFRWHISYSDNWL